jgi:RNA recognition motif-containing protein
VTYASNDAAKNCLTEKKLRNHRLDEKEIEVKRAMPRGNKDKNASLKTHKIFVGGLDTDVDEETSRL